MRNPNPIKIARNILWAAALAVFAFGIGWAVHDLRGSPGSAWLTASESATVGLLIALFQLAKEPDAVDRFFEEAKAKIKHAINREH